MRDNSYYPKYKNSRSNRNLTKLKTSPIRNVHYIASDTRRVTALPLPATTIPDNLPYSADVYDTVLTFSNRRPSYLSGTTIAELEGRTSVQAYYNDTFIKSCNCSSAGRKRLTDKLGLWVRATSTTHINLSYGGSWNDRDNVSKILNLAKNTKEKQFFIQLYNKDVFSLAEEFSNQPNIFIYLPAETYTGSKLPTFSFSATGTFGNDAEYFPDTKQNIVYSVPARSEDYISGRLPWWKIEDKHTYECNP